jgi:WD40 repeat protein
VLCHLEGKSMAEAAQQLGWKVGTVSGRLAQARKLLEKGLARHGLPLATVLSVTAIAQNSASAAIPAHAGDAAVKAAMLIARGLAPASAISVKAATLAQGTLRAMLATRVKCALLAAALGAALFGSAILAGLTSGHELPDPQVARAAALDQQSADQKTPEADTREAQPVAVETIDGLASAHIGTAQLRFPGQGMIAALADGRRALVFQPNTANAAWLVELSTGKIIHTYRGLPPSLGARGMVVLAGDRVAYCDNRDHLCVFDLNSGSVVQKCEKVMQGTSESHPVVVSGDGRLVAVPSGRRAPSGDGRNQHCGQVLVYDTKAGAVVADVRIDGYDVRGAALSEDGTRFAVFGVGVDPKAGPDGKAGKRMDLIEVREVASGKTVARMDWRVEGSAIPARFSPDGKYLGAALWPGVQVWETSTGRLTWNKEVPYIRVLRYSPDGRRLYAAASFGEVPAWDTESGQTVSVHKLSGTLDHGSGPVEDAVFTSDNRLLAVAWRGLVLSSWDVQASKLLTPADGFTWPVTAVRFTPDGREVIAATDALTVLRADAGTGRVVASFQMKLNDEQRADPILSTHWTHMASVALCPDARFLAYATHSRKLAMVELATGRVLWTAPVNGAGHTHNVAPRFSPDGAKVSASGYREPRGKDDAFRSIPMWDVATGMPLAAPEPGAGPVLLGGGRQASVAIAPDGTKAVVVAERGGLDGDQMLAWDIPTRQALANVRGGFGPWITIAPDSRTLIMTETNRIVGRDLLTGQITRSLPFLPPRDDAFGEFERRDRKWPRFALDHVGRHLTCPFILSPDGRLFAVGVRSPESDEPQIRVYEWAGFGHRFTLTGHAGSVRSLAFSPDCRYLASGSDDTTVKVWHLSKAWRAPSRKVPSTGESLWARLAGADADAAWEAMRELAARPDVAVALAKQRLRPAPLLTVSAADITSLIKQLDADAFTDRERADKGLRQLGPIAMAPLQQALKKPVSLEMKRRIEQLIEDAGRLDPRFPPQSRLIEVLEHIGSPAARAVLQTLAAGAPEDRQTIEARAALGRIKS